MCTKDLWKNDILSKDAGQWFASLLKISYFHRCFSLFRTFCNQLAGFTASGKFTANELKPCILNNIVKLYQKKKLVKNMSQ